MAGVAANQFGPQPPKLDIHWEERPKPIPKKYRGWKWESLLAPVKAVPGVEARVNVYDKVYAAREMVQRARRRLEQVDPLDVWEFHVGKMNTRDHFGVWVTYRGKRTRQEYAEELVKRKQRSVNYYKVREMHQAQRALAEAQGKTYIPDYMKGKRQRRLDAEAAGRPPARRVR